MTGIYWSEGETNIKKYGATTSGSKTVIRVEIETSDHFAAGSILSSIERAHAAQTPPTRPPVRPTKRTKLAAPLLQLTHRSGEED
ncbi:hypothetical protein [Devosia sp.]|uniref:hypothetical protein n=1 Tax=Devosia sp. TaxID=1871048 RepID=UPI001AC01FC4|nr:hypothetical protein [Devosia sp.]MBN9334694.1 hypothetical protein [Devosia sp.]